MTTHNDNYSAAALDAPRRVELTLARVDPWSVLKISFLLSVALGIAGVFTSIILWFVVDSMHVFAEIENFLTSMGAESFKALLDYVRLPKVMSYATIISVINVVLLTSIATLGALLYNVIASLVGGVRVSLMDE
ncbi:MULTISPECIES: DUF3566 domain-containing protein [unclassified Schaalia]|uniref:DUF3566 domain-containing protein n=1 Tax=unclassified Schaalia TaxID=2691889 RepID=UPI001E56C619|nr:MULTISPECIES: DUF3566 domain-containing protein [unclassified Schaalia]MCD4550105.1 DUF3566 domain-containing protein [Schaalia sp. lx-260]MCD4557828.1 DUF3566 domain-containing protein [Schaalia sp. lx-100]